MLISNKNPRLLGRGLASDGRRVERAMGIEHIAPKPLIFLNQGVMRSLERCVRFLCEIPCPSTQR
jgi:hypothetical protein